MKIRFLVNMILSTTQFVIGAFLIGYATKNNGGDLSNGVVAFIVILVMLTLVSFVMGIVTLALPKGKNRGLGIASGVTTLIPYSSVVGAAAIVSLIGYLKEK